MRNLKRALSLALSTVMLMGMMVVGTSAASYPDVKASHDAEAIEVMQAIGVMVGDENGKFNPDQKVTRNEAAVVIAKLMDLNVGDFKGADLSFTDVPDWAASFVAACQADGIIAGYDAKTFGGNDSVTAAQYALMVMKTLGYFQYESDYGEDWLLASAKQAGKIDLFDGVDVSVNAPLTREQVARITLNALEAAMVEADGNGGVTVEGDGFKVTTGNVKYEKIEEKKNNSIDDEYKTLGEDLFGTKLVKSDARDDLGRPATKWTYKNKEVGKYADEADKTVVADDTYKTILKAYQEMVDDDYDDAGDVIKALYVNGEKEDNQSAAQIEKGDRIEFYLKDGVVTNAIVTRFEIAQIDEIDTDVSKADKADDVTCYVELENGDRYDDTDVEGFDVDTYVEDAYILIATNKTNTKIIASQLAESVKGEVEVLRNGKARIDGEYYKDLTSDKLAIGDKGSFYLDLAGQIVAFDGEAEESDNYAYIYNVAADENGKDKYGNAADDIYTAYVVLADGTLASYVIDEDSVEDYKITEKTTGLVAYSINKNGELEIEDAADEIANNGAAISKVTMSDKKANIGTYKTSSKTEFVFVDITYKTSGKIDDVDTSVATGYKNIGFTAKDVFVVYDNNTDKNALYVFVLGENDEAESDAQVAIICDDAYVEWKDADDDVYYTYTAIVNGEETELTVAKADKLTVVEGQAYSYTLDSDGYVKAWNAANAGDKDFKYGYVIAKTDDYVVIGATKDATDGTQYNLDGVDKYTLVDELDKDGAHDEYYVVNGAKLNADASKNDTGVFYVVDDDDLVTIIMEKTNK